MAKNIFRQNSSENQRLRRWQTVNSYNTVPKSAHDNDRKFVNHLPERKSKVLNMSLKVAAVVCQAVIYTAGRANSIVRVNFL